MNKKEIKEQLEEVAKTLEVVATKLLYMYAHICADVSDDEDDDECSHCGQDAEEETSVSLKDLLGMEVVGVGKGKCDGCPMDHYQADCVKVELVGGDYICLAEPQPEEEEDGNVMGDIKEKVEEFIDYLDSVVGN